MAYHIYTYIISYYNLSARIIDLVSYITYVMCVNFIHKWREDLQFKRDFKRQIFWETFPGEILFVFDSYVLLSMNMMCTSNFKFFE